MVSDESQVIMQEAGENWKKNLSTRGICIKKDFEGEWMEVKKTRNQKEATTKGRRKTTRVSLKALTKEDKGRTVGFGCNRLIWVDSGLSMSLSHRFKKKKNGYTSTYGALN